MLKKDAEANNNNAREDNAPQPSTRATKVKAKVAKESTPATQSKAPRRADDDDDFLQEHMRRIKEKVRPPPL